VKFWCACIVSSPEVVPQSLVISSHVATKGGDGKADPVLMENPVIIDFEFQLVCFTCQLLSMSTVVPHLSKLLLL